MSILQISLVLISFFITLHAHFISKQYELSHTDYSNFGVIRCYYKDTTNPISNDQIYQKLSKYSNHIEIWTNNDKFVDFQINQHLFKKINQFSKRLNSKCEIIIDNLDTLIKESLPSNKWDYEFFDNMLKSYPNREDEIFDLINTNDIHHKLSKYFFQDYRDLNSLENWFHVLTQWFPDILNLYTLGSTFENNNLYALEINVNNKTANPDGKTIVMTGGLHSREWISISTVCYIMFQLLNEYALNNNGNNNQKGDHVFNSFNFVFIPVLNPDGYEYTWTTDRLWRKNRQDTGNKDCPGFDLDRTFGYHWQPTWEYPCSSNYNGETPFIAKESQLLDQYIKNKFGSAMNETLYVFLDFHSYSQEILYPFTYSCDDLPNDIENLLELAYDLSKRIRKYSGVQYDVRQSCKDRDADINPMAGSGSLLDYMYHKGAHISYQIKLRDTGNFGFLLPPKFIEPVGKEATDMVKALCDFLLNPSTWIF